MITNKRPYLFQVDNTAALGDVLNALREQFSLSDDSEQTLRSSYFDSFDWRLYQAGALLVESEDGRSHHLQWQDLATGMAHETIRLASPVPRFSWDYPPGLLRGMLEKELEMRTLLPQLELRTQVRQFRVLDSREKTVVRISLEENGARSPGQGEYRTMPCFIRLRPVRGYQKALADVETFLAGELGLDNLQHSRLELALAAIGRQPLDYSSKLNFELDGSAVADQVMRQIHLHLLETLEANVPGTRADLDSEFLHDLRVAVRRSRSALTQVKGVFPQEVVDRFKERLAWIGKITGETRDMDVYLLAYGEFKQSLPAEFQEDLQPLHAFLLAHQKSAHQAMLRKLNSPHFRATLKEWRSFLEADAVADDTAPNAQLPILKLARKRIYKTFKRVLDDGTAITPHCPPEALHDLRKDCKKLRYLLEFFQSLYGKQQVQPLIKTLKVLLNNLGDFQDLEVQALKLREFAHQMVAEGEVPADTLLAMGMLVDGLLKRQTQARAEFTESFAGFAKPANCRKYQQLFGGKSSKGGQSEQAEAGA